MIMIFVIRLNLRLPVSSHRREYSLLARRALCELKRTNLLSVMHPEGRLKYCFIEL